MDSLQFIETLKQWEKSQEGQTSGYEYEKTFVEMWQALGQSVFEGMANSKPARQREKKTSDEIREDRDS